jgi:hypothetical protein
VAEQFALGERGSHRAAVEHDEWAVGAQTRAMNGLGDQLFAAARFAFDEQCHVARGDAGEIGEELAHARRAAEQIAEAIADCLLASNGFR